MGKPLTTGQFSYEPMRGGDVTVVDTVLDSSTAGFTFHESDKPASAYELNPEYNAPIIIFETKDASDNKNISINLYGYPVNGPAEFIAELSLTVGTARINDSTRSLYVDTIVRTNDVSDGHAKKITIRDSGNNRIAKVWFDGMGLRNVYSEVSDMTTGMSVNPKIRSF